MTDRETQRVRRIVGYKSGLVVSLDADERGHRVAGDAGVHSAPFA